VGLTAGLLFAWAVSVIVGLALTGDRTYVESMQSINRTIQNPFFFSAFLGAAILLPASTYISYGSSDNKFWWLLTATAFYLIGVIGVTIFGNIPLNRRLDSFDLQRASSLQITEARTIFEQPWNRFNRIRTFAALISFLMIIASLTI